MKPASLAEIKRELKTRSDEELLEICLRLGRFKKDNKELLTYLLFDADDESSYITSVKYFIDDQFEEINTSNLYYAKKSLRRILRSLNKFIRYSGKKQTEIEILAHFCATLKSSSIEWRRSTVLKNMYQSQINKIGKALNSLHEDIRADYAIELQGLME